MLDCSFTRRGETIIDLEAAVKEGLRSAGANERTLDLWKKVFGWYQEGGSKLVKKQIKALAAELGRASEE